MPPLSVKLSVNSQIVYDGAFYRVVGFPSGNIQLESVHGGVILLSLSHLLNSGNYRVLQPHDDPDDLTADGADQATDDVVDLSMNAAAQLRLEHIREAVTGFKSGNPALALQGEPREIYDPACIQLTERMNAKAKELGIGNRTLHRQRADYQRLGIRALIDGRKGRPTRAIGRADQRLIDAIDQVIKDQTNKTNVTHAKLRRDVKKVLAARYGDGDVHIPSIPTFDKLMNERAVGKELFNSAKTRRGAASRPVTAFSRIESQRPGQYVIYDVTDLDAFGMDPISLEWIPLKLALGVDHLTRSIVARRFVHRDKQVDAALLLYDTIRPKRFHPHMPEDSRWGNTYIGIPEHIVINLSETEMPDGAAAIPVLKPTNVIVDRGKIFMSMAFEDACHRLGINVLPARPRTGTDKSYQERLHGSIGSLFVQYLDGYKGPNVWSRGTQGEVEEKAFYFIDELEVHFDDWCASFWQNRPHEGLKLGITPKLQLSPNQLYEEGLARAGFLYVPRDPNLYYELLPTAWVTVKPAGVSFSNLLYDGPVLTPYRNRTSDYPGMYAGKWPVRYDPRDLSQLFFFDLDVKRWLPIVRVHSQQPNRPFNDVTLGFVKSQILARGPDHLRVSKEEISARLDAVLDRMDAATLDNRNERRLAARRLEEARQATRDRPNHASSMESLAGAAQASPHPDGDLGTGDLKRRGQVQTPMQLYFEALNTASYEAGIPDIANWEDDDE